MQIYHIPVKMTWAMLAKSDALWIKHTHKVYNTTIIATNKQFLDIVFDISAAENTDRVEKKKGLN